jgi:hypothetical protein
MPAISNETVKPMPATEPAPEIASQPIGGPGACRSSFVESQEAARMPSGLPAT